MLEIRRQALIFPCFLFLWFIVNNSLTMLLFFVASTQLTWLGRRKATKRSMQKGFLQKSVQFIKLLTFTPALPSAPLYPVSPWEPLEKNSGTLLRVYYHAHCNKPLNYMAYVCRRYNARSDSLIVTGLQGNILPNYMALSHKDWELPNSQI